MSDLDKQKAFVKAKRKGATKVVKRGVRRRINAVENVMVTLIGELRATLQKLSDRHDQAEVLLGIMAKNHLAREVKDEELAALQEFLLKHEESQAGVTDDAAAGAGSDVQPGG